MDTDDVDSNTTSRTERYTARLFCSDKPYSLGCTPDVLMFHSGRLPDIPFDAVCASAILHHFATEELKDMLKGLRRHVFPGGVKTTLEKERDRAQRREAREKCRDRHGHLHVLDYAVHFDVSGSGESQVEGS